MIPIYPKRLSRGSHIRVIAPARSASILDAKLISAATKKLEGLGLTVSFGKNIFESDSQLTSSVESRLQDLHDAFADTSVDGILTAIGGYSSNQLLSSIDYNLIKANPKILCGYSDISALSNAILAKTGLVTYSGPHFSSFGMQEGFEYIEDYFKKALFSTESYEILPSDKWSDGMWFIDQLNRTYTPNDGPVAINLGEATGRVVGGHLRCLASLQGTEYWPSLEDSILFLEEDDEVNLMTFDRMLQSLIHQPDFNGVKGIVIGRFSPDSNAKLDNIVDMIKTKPELSNLPVIAGVDFGHTMPIATFPIGGTVQIKASDTNSSIVVTNH